MGENKTLGETRFKSLLGHSLAHGEECHLSKSPHLHKGDQTGAVLIKLKPAVNAKGCP